MNKSVCHTCQFIINPYVLCEYGRKVTQFGCPLYKDIGHKYQEHLMRKLIAKIKKFFANRLFFCNRSFQRGYTKGMVDCQLDYEKKIEPDRQICEIMMVEYPEIFQHIKEIRSDYDNWKMTMMI